MERITHDLIQGSEAWQSFRLDHFGASEAAAAMGISTKAKRSELLRAKHTGIAKEYSDWFQENVLDHGHAVEAKARPLIEAIIGDDLYPCTMSYGKLSASCDGLTMDCVTAFEHKQWNRELAESVASGVLPEEHMPQCQQIMHVTGARRVIFTVSDGTPENMVYMEVLPDDGWIERIHLAWAQFAIDLKAYQPPKYAEPAPVGHTRENLPALRVEVTGAVTASNVDAFKAHAFEVISSINQELATDQDFANAAADVKWLDEVRLNLKAVRQNILAQTGSIDEVLRVLDEIDAAAQKKSSSMEKLVTARKDQIKADIVQEGILAMSQHIATLNQRLGHNYMPVVPYDFGAAIKGKRTVDTLREAMTNELTRAKIAASAIADRIAINLQALDKVAVDYPTLFPDRAAIITKAADDLAALIQNRVNAETARLEAERAQIREEEQAKAQKDAEAQVAARAAADLAIAKAAEPAPAPAPAPMAAPMQTFAPVATARVVSITQASNEAPTVSLGEINSYLEFVSITAEGLNRLGFPVIAKEKAKCLYRASDLPKMRDALVNRLLAIQFQKAA